MTFGLGAGATAGLLAAATAIVVGLYLLRPPPRRFLVSSTLLWQRAIEQRKRRLHDRRFWLSLLASLVFSWAIAAALADPSWHGADDRIVIVIDNRATMATRTSAGPTRLEQAVKRARTLMQGASQVLLADTCGRIEERELAPRHVALQRLEALPVCLDSRTTLPRLDVPAGSRAFLITDGVGLPATSSGFETVSVFERAPNVAITAFAVRAEAGRPGTFEAYLAIENQGSEASDLEVEIVGSGPPLAGREHLEPGETVARAIALPAFVAGGVEARIRAAGDAFPLDDIAFDLLPRSAIRVRLRTQHSALVRALTLAPDLEPDDAQDREPAVVVVSGPEARTSARSASLEFITDDEVVALTGVVEVRSGHPLLRGVSPDDLIARTAAPLRAGEDEEWVARAGDTPLILARATPPRRVRIALSLDDSALTRRAGFPVLFANAVRWLAGGSRLAKAEPGVATAPVPLDSIRGPEGEPVAALSLSGRSIFEARSPGLFTAQMGSYAKSFGVDLAHPAAIGPNQSVLPASTPEESEGERASLDAWRVLIGLALALAIVDRWAFSRRVVQ